MSETLNREPEVVNGRPVIRFKGVAGHLPSGRHASPPIRSCRDFPKDGNKLVGSLKEALTKADLRDGMVISTHHHLRNGDEVAMAVFNAATELGVRNLVWFPSASFPCHAPLIECLESGVIHHIEGSLNGALGEFASRGRMMGTAVLRSHGGRYRAIQDGDVRIDIAVIAAPTADAFGNATGVVGPSACGSLGFAVADAQYADHVIVVTDNLVPFPCLPIQIYGNSVDQVVKVDRIGDPNQIVSGTTQVTKSPERLRIAKLAADLVVAAGLVQNGFSFQAGAGGTSLAFTQFLGNKMAELGVTASFARGGSTEVLVSMLESGLVGAILDGQTFDLTGVRSLRENPNHVPTSPFISYNYHGKGNVASMVDVAVLGATEIDLQFNANVVTHSDGLLLHGLGGWSDALFAGFTVLTVPTFRNRVPIIRDQLTTLCGPGELVDAVVTERGIAVNPSRTDILERLTGCDLPLVSLQELKDSAEKMCGGKPDLPELTDQSIGVVEWVDGTVIDVVWGVA
ncbi:MAG TPA: citrate lyase subunit alpha [Fimbriimonadaceae bacterium]|nr:citrate lyase subunit alpha [Fimbriimonadaceae bacterium]